MMYAPRTLEVGFTLSKLFSLHACVCFALAEWGLRLRVCAQNLRVSGMFVLVMIVVRAF